VTVRGDDRTMGHENLESGARIRTIVSKPAELDVGVAPDRFGLVDERLSTDAGSSFEMVRRI
jgi:hypothetical protein